MKTVEQLKEDKQLLLEAINILDTITEEENNHEVKRTDDNFQLYETWAVTDVKQEINSKIGEIEVQLGYNAQETTIPPETQVTE